MPVLVSQVRESDRQILHLEAGLNTMCLFSHRWKSNVFCRQPSQNGWEIVFGVGTGIPTGCGRRRVTVGGCRGE